MSTTPKTATGTALEESQQQDLAAYARRLVKPFGANKTVKDNTFGVARLRHASFTFWVSSGQGRPRSYVCSRVFPP